MTNDIIAKWYNNKTSERFSRTLNIFRAYYIMYYYVYNNTALKHIKLLASKDIG